LQNFCQKRFLTPFSLWEKVPDTFFSKRVPPIAWQSVGWVSIARFDKQTHALSGAEGVAPAEEARRRGYRVASRRALEDGTMIARARGWLAAALAVGFLAPFAWAQAEVPAAPSAAAEKATDRPETENAGAPESLEAPLGPVYVRPFEPMTVTLLGLKESGAPVYFRSPLAEPSPADASVDRCVPLAAGAALADWLMFTGRALAFPVEMVLCPPWTKFPLAD